jgi:predicted O-methyltransferase YrrM
MLNAFLEIADYLTYYLAGTTRHGLHSPFIYDFADFVLYQPSDINFEMIENQRMNMIKSHSKTTQTSLSQYAAISTLDSKYGRLLQRMVQYYQPKSILEIGNNTGIESNYILSNSVINHQPLNSYISVEVDDYFQKVRKETVESFANFYQSELVLNSNQLEENQLVDLCILHGQKNADDFWKYYDKYKYQLGTQSMLVVTNIRQTNDLYIYWNQRTNVPEVTASVELFKMGILFFRTEQRKQKFILRY